MLKPRRCGIVAQNLRSLCRTIESTTARSSAFIVSNRRMSGNKDSMSTCPRPMVDKQLAVELLQRLYAVTDGEEVEVLRELPSYDDRNYHVALSLENSEGRAEYVLKVLHESSSDNKDFLNAHMEMLVRLGNAGFRFPSPVPTKLGTQYTILKLPHALRPEPLDHGIMLLRFIPGVTVQSLGRPSSPLLASIGRTLARVHDCLEGLSGTAIEAGVQSRLLVWSIADALQCESGVVCIPDERLRCAVQSVLGRYREEIVPHMPSMRRGIIHGDVNENNIIIDPSNSREVFGFIDTFDTVYAPFVADLGICIAYLSLLLPETPVDWISPLVRSYCEERPLTDVEKESLHLWVLSRLAQCIAMGYKAYQADPTNDYLLVSCRPAGQVLPRLFALSTQELNRLLFSEQPCNGVAQ